MTTSQLLGIRAESATHPERAGWAIFATALILGLGGDLLLRATPWGLNATIWLAGLGLAGFVLPRIASLAFTSRRGNAWICAALGFSLTLSWRGSAVLGALNVAAVLLCLGMVAFRTRSGTVRLAGSTEFAAHLAVSAVQAVIGTLVLLVRHLDWRSVAVPGRTDRLAALGRGLAIAALPILVFGALFASADVFFRDLLRESLIVNPGEVLSHLALLLLFAWLAASYLWGALIAEREPVPEAPRIGWLRFEFIETGVVLGSINILFLAFVGVQFRYLFGGADRVVASSSLTYAEYARRGFFELVAVAALVVPFLLLTQWLLPKQHTRLQRFHALLAAALVALVFVVMASALQRMRLYQQAFGLTELRLYTSAFMAWLFIVFVWLILTALRSRRDRFAFGVFIAGLVVLAGLNVLNPDAFIVRRNVAAASEVRPFDVTYALDLGPGAVPPLIANLDKLSSEEQCTVAHELRRRYVNSDDDWQSWSWGRSRARNAVSSSARLASACDAQPPG